MKQRDVKVGDVYTLGISAADVAQYPRSAVSARVVSGPVTVDISGGWSRRNTIRNLFEIDLIDDHRFARSEERDGRCYVEARYIIEPVSATQERIQTQIAQRQETARATACKARVEAALRGEGTVTIRPDHTIVVQLTPDQAQQLVCRLETLGCVEETDLDGELSRRQSDQIQTVR